MTYKFDQKMSMRKVQLGEIWTKSAIQNILFKTS